MDKEEQDLLESKTFDKTGVRMSEEEVRKYIELHSGEENYIGRGKLIEKTGWTEGPIYRLIKQIRGFKGKEPVQSFASQSVEQRKDEYAGVQGFRQLHDMEERLKRRDEHIHGLIQIFVNGALKKRGWYYDSDIARIIGITSAELIRHRGNWIHLQVEARIDDTKGTRKLAWCHPDIVDICREIAERS